MAELNVLVLLSIPALKPPRVDDAVIARAAAASKAATNAPLVKTDAMPRVALLRLSDWSPRVSDHESRRCGRTGERARVAGHHSTDRPSGPRIDRITPRLTSRSPGARPAGCASPGTARRPGHPAGWDRRGRLGTLGDVDVDIRPVPAAASYPLRQAVLRPHQSIEEMFWEGDEEPETATFAAVERDSGAIVGVATVYPEPAPFEADEEPQPPDGRQTRSWHLRGMATREDFRGPGDRFAGTRGSPRPRRGWGRRARMVQRPGEGDRFLRTGGL